MNYPILRRGTFLPATLLMGLLAATGASAQTIDQTNWGTVTSPVYNQFETGTYASAELFAGPNKFGSYYSGVLPNGKMVRPAGVSAQIGQNPLGAALTPDGKFLITTNDDERNNGTSLQTNAIGGYTISVIDTVTMKIVGQTANNASGKLFIGIQVTGNGPYTVYASGGGDNNIKLFTVSTTGGISAATPSAITIAPILPADQGYVSHYTANLPTGTPVPSGFGSVTSSANLTFPAGSTLSPDGRYLYVACNGDNSVAVIDTTTNQVVKQVPVGFFPYGVALSGNGAKLFVSNWGVSQYKFANAGYDPNKNLTSVGSTGNLPDGFYVPATSTSGTNPQTSSVSIVSVPGANPVNAALLGSIYQGQTLDAQTKVGDTHPSAMAVVRNAGTEVLYVTKANNDSIGLILMNNNRKLPDFDLSPLGITPADGHKVHGSYPNAIAVSPDNRRVYVAEAGLNSIAVLDTTLPTKPKLIGRIPTGWYPTGVTLSADGNTLYVVNAKGIGEDINPATDATNGNPTGIESFADGNFIFGSAQKIDLRTLALDTQTVLGYNFAVNKPTNTSVVPAGGNTGSERIKHVFFILHENKTFDSMLGNQPQFGAFASTTFNSSTGAVESAVQFTGVALNIQALANAFATGVNYYSDAEESDAGHQFAASGTATDYTEKTLLVKTGRGLLVNKNFEPEDYPEGGYIFNNAARNGVSFKDYGALVRIEGTDTGSSKPTTINDSRSGNVGYPKLNGSNLSNPLVNLGDTGGGTHDPSDTTTQTVGTSPGLGQSYFMKLPILSILGTNNDGTGEARLDKNYPGYNFNISDQRRAQEFIADFDRMVNAGTLPKFLYIYQPNDHTGGVQAPNATVVGTSPGSAGSRWRCRTWHGSQPYHEQPDLLQRRK